MMRGLVLVIVLVLLSVPNTLGDPRHLKKSGKGKGKGHGKGKGKGGKKGHGGSPSGKGKSMKATRDGPLENNIFEEGQTPDYPTASPTCVECDDVEALGGVTGEDTGTSNGVSNVQDPQDESDLQHRDGVTTSAPTCLECDDVQLSQGQGETAAEQKSQSYSSAACGQRIAEKGVVSLGIFMRTSLLFVVFYISLRYML